MPEGATRAGAQKPLETWQLVVGLIFSAPLILPLLAELLWAVLLRAACSLYKIPEPSLGRAWWISFLAFAAILPVRIVLALIVAAAGLPPVVDLLLGMTTSMLILAGIYRATLSVRYGQGIVLWLLQALFVSPVLLVVIVLMQMA